MEGMRLGDLHKKYSVQSWVDKWLALKVEIPPDDYDKVLSDAPTGLRPPAQGCRFGYPG